MRVLKSNDYKLFEQLVKIKQPALLKTMSNFLKKHYKTVVTKKDYIYAIGDIPVALVAHLDTVFRASPENIYYDQQKNVMWSPEGLGADDRAGVFAIVKIIQQGYHPHIILTTDEEMGALGAKQLVSNLKQPFADMKYIIQLDRRGTNDCVFYNCYNEDFIEYVESFGFIEAFGSFSDISEICPKWGIAGVNLSIGYQNEHSYTETLHINAFLATIDKVVNMLKDIENSKYFLYLPATGLSNSWQYIGVDWLGDEIKCHCCNQYYSDYEMFPVKSLDKHTYFYCPDCLIGKVNWCDICGEAFEISPDNPEEKLCPDCGGKVNAAQGRN